MASPHAQTHTFVRVKSRMDSDIRRWKLFKCSTLDALLEEVAKVHQLDKTRVYIEAAGGRHIESAEDVVALFDHEAPPRVTLAISVKDLSDAEETVSSDVNAPAASAEPGKRSDTVKSLRDLFSTEDGAEHFLNEFSTEIHTLVDGVPFQVAEHENFGPETLLAEFLHAVGRAPKGPCEAGTCGSCLVTVACPSRSSLGDRLEATPVKACRMLLASCDGLSVSTGRESDVGGESPPEGASHVLNGDHSCGSHTHGAGCASHATDEFQDLFSELMDREGSSSCSTSLSKGSCGHSSRGHAGAAADGESMSEVLQKYARLGSTEDKKVDHLRFGDKCGKTGLDCAGSCTTGGTACKSGDIEDAVKISDGDTHASGGDKELQMNSIMRRSPSSLFFRPLTESQFGSLLSLLRQTIPDFGSPASTPTPKSMPPRVVFLSVSSSAEGNLAAPTDPINGYVTHKSNGGNGLISNGFKKPVREVGSSVPVFCASDSVLPRSYLTGGKRDGEDGSSDLIPAMTIYVDVSALAASSLDVVA